MAYDPHDSAQGDSLAAMRPSGVSNLSQTPHPFDSKYGESTSTFSTPVPLPDCSMSFGLLDRSFAQ